MRCAHCDSANKTTLRDFFDSVGAFQCASCGERSYICIEAFCARIMLLAVPWFFATSARMARDDFDELGNLGWSVCAGVTLIPIVMYFVFFRRIDGAVQSLPNSSLKMRWVFWLGEVGMVATFLFANVLMAVGSDSLLLKAIATILSAFGAVVLIGCLIVMFKIDLSKSESTSESS